MNQYQVAAKVINRTMPDYPFIRAWGRLMGSQGFYVENQVIRAKETNAPSDAIYEEMPRSGKWATFENITNEITKDTIAAFVLELAR